MHPPQNKSSQHFIPSIRPEFESLCAYVPGEQPTDPDTIKLNTNEFPYPAAPPVLDALRRDATDRVRVYPNPTCAPVREKLAALHAVSPDQILVGNGSDEVLRLLVHAFGGPGRTLAVVDPSYSLYPILAQQFQTTLRVHPLAADAEFPQSLLDETAELCFLPVPNPPIGTNWSTADLRPLAEKNWLLVLDGAYVDFAPGDSARPLLDDFPNVVLTRTFSKSSGLAGMRVGYAIGDPRLIAQLHKLRDSYNVNRLSQTAALAALDARDYYLSRCAEIVATRERLAAELRARGFTVPPSHGNFIFARHPRAPQLYTALKQRRILVRYFDVPGLRDGLRITIGTPAEIDKLLAALGDLASPDAKNHLQD